MREMIGEERKAVKPISAFECGGHHVNLYSTDIDKYWVSVWDDGREHKCNMIPFMSLEFASDIRDACIEKIRERNLIN